MLHYTLSLPIDYLVKNTGTQGSVVARKIMFTELSKQASIENLKLDLMAILELFTKNNTANSIIRNTISGD